MKLYHALQSQGLARANTAWARAGGEVAVNGAICDNPEAQVDRRSWN